MDATSPILAGLPIIATEAAANASSIPWLWIVIGAVVFTAAVVGFIAYRAGGELADPVRLIVTTGTQSGNEIPIRSAFVTLGAEKDNDVVVDDEKVSKHHARLTYTKKTLMIADTNSLYGTFVSGERVEQATCKDGDRIRLGTQFECRVALPSA